MDKYVIKGDLYFEVTESKGRFIIRPCEHNIKGLIEILNEDKKDFFSSIIDSFLNKEIPVSWLKEEFIRDIDFVREYHPEYLI